KVLAVQPEDVEDNEQFPAVALLQKLEARRAMLIEDDDLTVEHDVGKFQFRKGGGDGGKAGRQIELVPAPNRHAAIDDCRHGPEAVVLQLERPALPVARRRLRDRRQHRREEGLEQSLGRLFARCHVRFWLSLWELLCCQIASYNPRPCPATSRNSNPPPHSGRPRSGDSRFGLGTRLWALTAMFQD